MHCRNVSGANSRVEDPPWEPPKAIGDECVMWQDHISSRWRRAVMIVTIFDGIGVTRVHAVIYHGDGKEQWWYRPFDHSSDKCDCMQPYILKCDVTSILAVISLTIWPFQTTNLIIGDECVMWQGFMQSYIIEMAKSSDDIDHFWWNWCHKGACSHVSWRWWRAAMILTIWPSQATVWALVTNVWPMCDVTRVPAAIYHADGEAQWRLTTAWALGMNVSCGKIIYQEQWWYRPFDHSRPLLEHWGPMCDQWVMWQGCLQSYIMQMVKISDDIADSRGEDPRWDRPKAIGDQCVMWQVCMQPWILWSPSDTSQQHWVAGNEAEQLDDKPCAWYASQLKWVG